MNISGFNNFLNISNQTGLSFKLEATLYSTTGSGDFGFYNTTGKNSINFKVNKNYLYDPSGRIVYHVNDNKKFQISGSINSTGYSYYINGNEIFKNNIRETFTLNNFYYNLSGTSGSIDDLIIYGATPSVIAELPNYLVQSKNLTGNFRNLSNQDLRISKIDVQNPNFVLINNPTGLYKYTEGKNFVLSGKDITNYLQVFSIPIVISGDFGSKKFFTRATGSTTYTNSINAFVYAPVIVDNTSTYYNDECTLLLLCESINYNTSPSTSNNRTVNLSLDYVSGFTGRFNSNLIGSGTATITYSGELVGSGYLSTGVNLNITGQDPYLGNNKNYSSILTGKKSFNLNEFFYMTGKNLIQNITGILGSGISGGNWVTGYFNTRITGDTSLTMSGYITSGTMTGGGNVYGLGISGDTLGLGLTGFIDQIPATGLIYSSIYYNGTGISGNYRPNVTGDFSGSFLKTFQNTFNISTGFYHDTYGNILNSSSIKEISSMNATNTSYSGSCGLTGEIKFLYINIDHYNINNSGMIGKLSITGTDSVGSYPFVQSIFITGNF